MLTIWSIEEKLKDVVHLPNQEQQICHILTSFHTLFSSEKLSFYRFSPVGYMAEGIAQLTNDAFESISYIRDDLRALPAIRKVVDSCHAAYYSGTDYITNVSSRYTLQRPIYGVLVVPIYVHNLSVAYLCSEYIEQNPNISPSFLESCNQFGALAGKLLVQKQTPAHPKLSPRENTILEALTNGLSTKEMTDLLMLSEATIKQYIKTALQKLGAKNRAHAVSIFMRQ
ncbi:MAG: helix-turn-helix transcriptional regulator [Solibacillus sp.]